MRGILVFIVIMLALGAIGLQQNGWSTACKAPYHTEQVGDSQACG